MNRWEHDIQGVTKQEIYNFCVCDKEWQEFRLSLKGVSTFAKLLKLEMWQRQRDVQGIDKRRTQVQVDNYINALKRGGQLDLEGNVVR